MSQPRSKRPACPECAANRTIHTDTLNDRNVFYCPKCGHVWHVGTHTPKSA
jgi:ribosomal protein L37AE/L43A